MKKILLGVVVTLVAIQGKRIYDFGKYAEDHPDDPAVIRRQEALDSLRYIWNLLKSSWEEIKIDEKFDAIVKDIDIEEQHE